MKLRTRQAGSCLWQDQNGSVENWQLKSPAKQQSQTWTSGQSTNRRGTEGGGERGSLGSKRRQFQGRGQEILKKSRVIDTCRYRHKIQGAEPRKNVIE